MKGENQNLKICLLVHLLITFVTDRWTWEILKFFMIDRYHYNYETLDTFLTTQSSPETIAIILDSMLYLIAQYTHENPKRLAEPVTTYTTVRELRDIIKNLDR